MIICSTSRLAMGQRQESRDHPYRSLPRYQQRVFPPVAARHREAACYQVNNLTRLGTACSPPSVSPSGRRRSLSHADDNAALRSCNLQLAIPASRQGTRMRYEILGYPSSVLLHCRRLPSASRGCNVRRKGERLCQVYFLLRGTCCASSASCELSSGLC